MTDHPARIRLDDLTSDQLDELYADLARAEAKGATAATVTALYEQWLKAGPPPLGVPMARWWDKRLVELRAALNTPEAAS